MIEKKVFGKMEDGSEVYEYVITSRSAKASIITYGATIKDLFVPSKNGLIDVSLGYDTLEEYQKNDGYLGATVGRNSNRLNGKKFEINGKPMKVKLNNLGKNNLHGGEVGFTYRNFSEHKIDRQKKSVELSLFSPNLEEGFLGNMNFFVKFTLKGKELIIEYRATCDSDTVANFTNHAYFNLDGEGSGTITNTMAKFYAENYTPVNKYLIPNGKIASVKRTPFNFLKFKEIGKDLNKNNKQLKYMRGYDVNFCVESDGKFKKVATCYSKESLVCVDVYTDLPAILLYSGGALSYRKGKNNNYYDKMHGFCLETQFYPDALNHPNFPSIILEKDKEFYSKTSYKFRVRKG